MTKLNMTSDPVKPGTAPAATPESKPTTPSEAAPAAPASGK
jgi:hypothetical protein